MRECFMNGLSQCVAERYRHTFLLAHANTRRVRTQASDPVSVTPEVLRDACSAPCLPLDLSSFYDIPPRASRPLRQSARQAARNARRATEDCTPRPKSRTVFHAAPMRVLEGAWGCANTLVCMTFFLKHAVQEKISDRGANIFFSCRFPGLKSLVRRRDFGLLSNPPQKQERLFRATS